MSDLEKLVRRLAKDKRYNTVMNKGNSDPALISKRDFWNVIGKYRKHPTFRFLILTVFSFLIVLSVTVACREWFGAKTTHAYLAGLISAFVLNFLGLRYFVYRGTTRSVRFQLLGFTASSLFFRSAEYISFHFVHDHFGPYYPVAILLIQGVSFVLKYLLYHYVLFGSRSDRG